MKLNWELNERRRQARELLKASGELVRNINVSQRFNKELFRPTIGIGMHIIETDYGKRKVKTEFRDDIFRMIRK